MQDRATVACANALATTERPSAYVSRVDFDPANTRPADFTDTRGRSVDFSGARLNGANFEGAVLNDVNLRGAKTNGVVWPDGWTSTGLRTSDVGPGICAGLGSP